jgi:hypothetical protein
MKTLHSVIITALLHTAALAQFEGVVESRNLTIDERGVEQRYVMTMWVRKDMVRVQIPPVGDMPGSTVIHRSDRKLSWVLNDLEKSYFEVSLLPEVQQRATVPDMDSADRPVFVRTKKTRKVLGYQCEQVIVKRGDSETEIWGAKGLTALTAVLEGTLAQDTRSGEGYEEKMIARMKIFPVISTTRYDGKIIESQEITRIEMKPVGAELFVVPAGYVKQKDVEMQEQQVTPR